MSRASCWSSTTWIWVITESNIHHVPEFTDRLYVIERGEIIFAGTPSEATRDPAVARIIEGIGPAGCTAS